MRDNWLKQKIENFNGKAWDSVLVIGADADFNSFYKDLKEDLQSEDGSAEIKDILSKEDYEALEDYIFYGDAGAVSQKLIEQIHGSIYAVIDAERNNFYEY